MDKDAVLTSLSFIKELTAVENSLTTTLKKLFEVKYKVGKAGVISDNLYDFLAKWNAPASLLSIKENLKEVNITLFQFLVIHTIIDQNKNISTLNDLNAFIKTHNEYFNFESAFRIIVYQDYFELQKWGNYALSSDFEWRDIHILDKALPHVSVTMNDLFLYIKNVVSKHENDLALPSLGKAIFEKLKGDKKLYEDVCENIFDVVNDINLIRFLPTFLNALINNEASKFIKYYSLLLSEYRDTHTYSILRALAGACPDKPECRKLLLSTVIEKRDNELILPGEYVDLCSFLNIKNEDSTNYIRELAKATDQPQDIWQIAVYLVSNISYRSEEWYRDTAIKVVTAPIAGARAIDYFLSELSHIDTDLTYFMLTERFKALGDKAISEANLSEMITSDHEAFKRNWTIWLNSEDQNIHYALRRFCTVRYLDASIFSLSADVLNNLSSSDKLYIAVKIIAYIYSKDHLQKMMFSLVESVKPSEKGLLAQLFDLFDQYVIYNYRTTLDTIKEKIKSKSIPAHILKFYKDLDQKYEAYFKALNSIARLPEILPDNKLAQNLQFFQQQEFDEISKKTKKGGLAEYFKQVSVHSHKWAIRRPKEKVHDVRPMGKIQYSMEYPSGEKLNPIDQERMRWKYQQINKNEISLS